MGLLHGRKGSIDRSLKHRAITRNKKGSIVCLKHRVMTGKGCEENISCGRNVAERAALGKMDGVSSPSHWE